VPDGKQGNAANIILGYVTGTGPYTAVMSDQYNPSGDSHSTDVSGGGVDNITNISGTEIGGVTELSFKYPLNTGSARDQVLIGGNFYNFFMAHHLTNDNLTSNHGSSNRGVIQNTQF
jgi:hypothetical protein